MLARLLSRLLALFGIDPRGAACGWLMTPMIFFSAVTQEHGRELWATSGTAETTRMVKDIRPGKEGSDPRDITAFDGRVWFTADDGSGRTLWVTDGTRENTRPVVRRGTRPLDPGWLTVFNGQLFFSARDKKHGRELWSTTGREGDTTLFLDINRTPKGEATEDSSPSHLTVFGDLLFFAADDGRNGRRLWSTTGRRGQTSVVRRGPDEIVPGAGLNPASLTPFADSLYYAADNARGQRELWSLTGRADGTPTLVVPAGKPAVDRPLYPTDLIVFNRSLYFVGDNGKSGRELWSLTGLRDATPTLVKDLNRGAKSSDPRFLTIYNNSLYFSADDGIVGRELWSLTGVKDATPTLVKDINFTEGESSNPADLFAFGGALYFSADDGRTGRQLWSTRGDMRGPSATARINIGLRLGAVGSGEIESAGLAGVLFFAADFGTPRIGRELGTLTGLEQNQYLRFYERLPANAPREPRFLTTCDVRR